MSGFRKFVIVLWYSLAAYMVIGVVGQLHNNWPTMWLPRMAAILGILLLVGFFVLIHMLVFEFRAVLHQTPSCGAETTAESASFPSPITVAIGGLLLFETTASILALFLSLNPPPWPTYLPRPFSSLAPAAQELLVTMFAGTVGSMVTTILGYLEHVSYKKDFDRAFVPWYIGRPLIGTLMGLLFYFVLRGGLLVLTPPNQGQLENVNLLGLAAVGCLVGLFSKNAVEKLREVFHSLFPVET